jgi:hypothetical protein
MTIQNNFCPQCGQVKHVGYDLCIDCLSHALFPADEEERFKQGFKPKGEKKAFIAIGVMIAIALFVITWAIGINI